MSTGLYYFHTKLPFLRTGIRPRSIYCRFDLNKLCWVQRVILDHYSWKRHNATVLGYINHTVKLKSNLSSPPSEIWLCYDKFLLIKAKLSCIYDYRPNTSDIYDGFRPTWHNSVVYSNELWLIFANNRRYQFNLMTQLN